MCAEKDPDAQELGQQASFLEQGFFYIFFFLPVTHFLLKKLRIDKHNKKHFAFIPWLILSEFPVTVCSEIFYHCQIPTAPYSLT